VQEVSSAKTIDLLLRVDIFKLLTEFEYNAILFKTLKRYKFCKLN